jgi:hypothetical protein
MNAYNRGDYVRLKSISSGTIGVVWEIQQSKLQPVEVYWPAGKSSRVSSSHRMDELIVVSEGEVREEMTNFKRGLGL